MFTIPVKVQDLQKGYNNGKQIGRTRFTYECAPTYRGYKINMVFVQKDTVLYYPWVSFGKQMLNLTPMSKFQGVAYIDD